MAEKGFGKMNDFDSLRKHYEKMFSLVDDFHFNSRHTREIFETCLGQDLPGEVISITHGEIRDQRVRRAFSSDVVRLGFIGSGAPYKGLPMLLGALRDMRKEGFVNWELLIYGAGRFTGGDDSSDSDVKWMGNFVREQADMVYEGMDLLIVPSICHETFGLIVLEALSRGVPVLVSSTVGAGDIVSRIDPSFIFTDENDLKHKLKFICNTPPRGLLEDFNEKIMSLNWDFDIENHSRLMKSFYEGR